MINPLSKSNQKPPDFSEAKKNLNKKQIAKQSQGSIQEQHALELITKGKLKEAEKIYREVIEQDSPSGIQHGQALGMYCR